MDEIVNNNNGEIQPLPAKPQFLQHDNTNDIIMWLHENARTKTRTRFLIPAVWRLLEERIREYPNEAREVDEDGNLPIHRVLYASEAFNKSTAAPLSLVHVLIERYPDGLHVQDGNGCIPLYLAMDHPCIDCFRAVLYNGGVEATTIQDRNGESPLYRSTWPDASLARLWELINYNREGVSIQNKSDMPAFELLDDDDEEEEDYAIGRQQEFSIRQDAKFILLKMAAKYNHVLEIRIDEMIQLIETHPACSLLAELLETRNDDFILHGALEAKCPHVLIEALVQNLSKPSTTRAC
jgi:hypothetical protein